MSPRGQLTRRHPFLHHAAQHKEATHAHDEDGSNRAKLRKGPEGPGHGTPCRLIGVTILRHGVTFNYGVDPLQEIGRRRGQRRSLDERDGLAQQSQLLAACLACCQVLLQLGRLRGVKHPVHVRRKLFYYAFTLHFNPARTSFSFTRVRALASRDFTVPTEHASVSAISS